MMHAWKSVAAAVLTLSAIAASAEAGTITAASGPIKVNGSEVRLEAGKTLALTKTQRVETMGSTVNYRSDTGDDLVFDSNSVLVEQETTDTAAGVFLMKGSATGTLSDKTQLGVAVGWISAPRGMKTKVLVEPAGGRENSEALIRATDGTAWVRYGTSYSVSLRAAHSVTLNIDPAAPGTLCFRTGQQNAGDVEIHRTAAGGDIIAYVPKATLGCFSDVPGENKTKICNDINSLKTAKIRLATRFVGKSPNEAQIGPGTCAQIDNATGTIDVLFTAVKFEILERAINLTTEFATLTQSNFSDVK